MAHLIDKDVAIAEIEKRIVEYKDMKIDSSYYEGMVASLEFFRDEFINTLEVKEVDLEKEIREYLSTYWPKEKELHPFLGHMVKHFFELGLKASNPLTWEDIKLIWNIAYEIDNMPEEEFYKEVLKRFKAKKEKRYVK